MQDLLGRLTALDPDASETLKVVAYFDTLVARSAGAESMLRGAAMLSGVTVGYHDGTRALRVRADGVRIDPVDPDPGWMRREGAPAAVAWIERDGEPHANDAMILERLVLALGILHARRSIGTESAVEVAISSYVGADERAAALSRLRLASTGLRVVASPPDPAPGPEYPSAVVATRHGLTRATLLDASIDPARVWGRPVRLGVGVPVPGSGLASSWSSALIAARLTTVAEPVLDAKDLGAFLLIAESAGPRHPDVDVLAGLDARSRDLLDAVAEAQSIRAAATRLGRHHSSVQERMNALVDLLGYDPRTHRGRTRYTLARMLLRLSEGA